MFKNVHPDIFISEATHIPIKTLVKKIRIIDPELAYLTHYSDEDKNHIVEILTKETNESPKNILLAEDSLSFDL